MNIIEADKLRNPAVRWMTIVTDGSERLLRLQTESIRSAWSGRVGEMATPATVGDAVSALWRLPALYGALFEEAAEQARRSFHILSEMQNELVDLACDALVQQAPVVAESLASGNVLFADRRHRSVVINFPDRRGMIARSRSQSA